MKIAFIGDTHNSSYAIKLAMNCINNEDVDVLIHLGDCTDDIEEISKYYKGKIYAVSGNCDFYSNYPNEQLLNIDGKSIFITHGNLYGVKYNLTSLAIKAESVGADIALFGHTHVKTREEYNGVLLMNPGSISKPSPWSRVGAVGIINILDDGSIDAKLIDVDMLL